MNWRFFWFVLYACTAFYHSNDYRQIRWFSSYQIWNYFTHSLIFWISAHQIKRWLISIVVFPYSNKWAANRIQYRLSASRYGLKAFCGFRFCHYHTFPFGFVYNICISVLMLNCSTEKTNASASLIKNKKVFIDRLFFFLLKWKHFAWTFFSKLHPFQLQIYSCHNNRFHDIVNVYGWWWAQRLLRK